MKKAGINSGQKLKISLNVNCMGQDDEDMEKARTETRRLMDDIWQRYPRAQVASSNLNNGKVVFEI